MAALLQISGLWRGVPIILASRSVGRARLLNAAGVPFEAVESGLDERRVPGVELLDPVIQAETLALAKARLVSARYPSRTVVGADQTLAFAGRTLHKPLDLDQALLQLRSLSGERHQLHSAVACVHDGETLFEFVDSAEIRMRAVQENVLAAYARAMGKGLLATVGGYEIEGLGVNLLDSVEGDIFTVIGLPLFRLLAEFRQIGLIGEDNDAR